jgi:hypothetical protein
MIVVDRINMDQVRGYGYKGAVGGLYAGLFINLAAEFLGSRDVCIEEARDPSVDVFNQKLIACYKEFRIGQLIIIPLTVVLGHAGGVLVGLTEQVARNIFRRIN